MKKFSRYIKCPRCELNYIPNGENLCDICKAELNLIQIESLLTDDEEILCPICKQNYMSIDDDMCLKCTERVSESDTKVVTEEEDDWESFLDDDKDTEIPADELEIVSLSELEAEEKDEEDEEDIYDEVDDFINPDEVDPDDFDEDEEDEDDDDDDF